MQYSNPDRSHPAAHPVCRGEIYLIDLTGYVGSEQSGIRPAVILQNDTGNEHSPTTIVAPLTSRSKRMSATHVILTPADAGVAKDSTVLCEQVRVIDKTRIKKKLGKISSQKKLNDINTKIMISFGIEEA